MESGFIKVIKFFLKVKEKGVEVVFKSIFWFVKEGIFIYKYISLLLFVEILDCLNV